MSDCALVFWMVAKYGLANLKSTELRSALFAANCEFGICVSLSPIRVKLREVGFDTEPSPIWLEHGGQIVFPYFGSSSDLTVKGTLVKFMDGLDSMPWGLAAQLRQVLVKLLEEEKGQ